VGQNQDGRLEVFRVDVRGELFHKWQKETNGDWSPWVSLGGWLWPDIAVANQADGRLEAFAVDRVTRLLRYKWQTAPNHPDFDWTTWITVGDSGMFRPPACVAQNADGRLEIFAVDAESGLVRHVWEKSTNGAWSRWADLGPKLEPGLCVTKDKDGRLELFGISSDGGDLLQCSQKAPNRGEEWSRWTSLGAYFCPELSVGQNTDGRLEVFGLSRIYGSVEHVYQTPSGGWSVPSSLGGEFFVGGAAVERRANGALEVFAVNGQERTLHHCWQARPGGSESWAGWQSLGGSVRAPPAVGRNLDGNLEVFAGDFERTATLDRRRQISDNAGWLDWQDVNQPIYQYASRIWQIAEGLPHNEVQAIAQTWDGYLWVGTRGGLARFDGINFTSFDPKNTPELRDVAITALCVDRRGTLWIGTGGGSVVQFKDGAFAQCRGAEVATKGPVSVIRELKDGSILIGSTNGISRYEAGGFTPFLQESGRSSPLVRYLFEDQQGDLWIATENGLNRWHDGKLDSFTVAEGLTHNSVRTIYQDLSGRLWAGLDNGLAWYDGKAFHTYTTQSGLSDKRVSAIAGDSRGNLWVGTYSGLNRFVQGRFLTELDNEGVPYDKINALFQDRERNLWVGSKEGLLRLTPKRFFTYNMKQGITCNNVVSVLEDRNGTVWSATWGGGINRMKGERVIGWDLAGGFTNGLALSICEGHDGCLWFGADFDGGLARYTSRQTTYYTWKNGLIKAALKVLYEDAKANLWIGTGKGLSRLKDGKFVNFSVKDGLAGENIRAICEDAGGWVWIGTDRGVSRWKDGRFSNLAAPEPGSAGVFAGVSARWIVAGEDAGAPRLSVTALFPDKEGSIWIGTEASGLLRYKQGRLTAYTSGDGLYSDEIFEIIQDDYGWLWMSCSRGVFRVRKANLDAFDEGKTRVIASIAYGRADGMESTQCNGVAKPGAWKARDGKLWFPTTKGLVAVDPKIEIEKNPPPVFIEQLIADGRPIPAKPAASSTQAEQPVRIPAGRGELEFHFAALNFQTPEKSKFKYRLEGVDQDWVSAEGRHAVHYNSLSPGRYRFRVIACNSDGVWNEAGASLAVVVLPHFWQTSWFSALVVLSCLGSVGSVARYVTKARMQRRLEALERQHAVERERGRIANDIHDELGSSLTRIMLLGRRAHEDAARPEALAVHTEKIVTTALATVQALDEIVWAVDPKKDTLEGLVGYIVQYANQFFEGSPVRCRLETPVKLPPMVLPAEMRHDLFLVVKEALNNVLKHSGASEARVQLTEAAGTVTIRIEDDGRGCNPLKPNGARSGHGLENMRHRMEKLGGSFRLTTPGGRGTALELTVCVNGKP
jgi:ligand-binding sensor domain-containing protein/signal transduction histidine kinase